MKVSTKGRYAVRVMLDLAMHNTGEYIPLKEISARQNITVKYLEQIIGMLNRAGMLNSLRGNNGGYRLAKAPEEYTIGDVLRITEGNVSLAPCIDEGNQDCERRSGCVACSFWTGLDKVINDYIDSYTLADLMKRAEENDWDYYVI
jgi:Rrf2 family protein